MLPAVMTEHAIDLPLSPEEAVSAVQKTAEEWGAEFERNGSGGQLRLPVLAGLRRGLMTGMIEVRPEVEGSRVVFWPEQSVYHVQVSAVVVLLVAVSGGLLTVLWPFFPHLRPGAAFGASLALGGWFLVISKLRTSGPDEFLEAVAAVGEGLGTEKP